MVGGFGIDIQHNPVRVHGELSLTAVHDDGGVKHRDFYIQSVLGGWLGLFLLLSVREERAEAALSHHEDIGRLVFAPDGPCGPLPAAPPNAIKSWFPGILVAMGAVGRRRHESWTSGLPLRNRTTKAGVILVEEA